MATINKTRMTRDLQSINDYLNVYYHSLNQIYNDLKKMEKGVGGEPFWNGAKAYTFYNTAVKILKENARCYSELYQLLKNLENEYVTILNYDRN